MRVWISDDLMKSRLERNVYVQSHEYLYKNDIEFILLTIFFIALNNGGASFMSKALAKSTFFKEIDN